MHLTSNFSAKIGGLGVGEGTRGLGGSSSHLKGEGRGVSFFLRRKERERGNNKARMNEIKVPS